ncbi:hypothetical protein QBC35DRAFT_372859 [Podospora australis]|uniref:RBR-type E3 ubiquitin transferase n=1 Tax=Podospora australis TaxID=1536484 RepID=A0AAN6X2Q6_9PEZI|nr:hypothetical protein QBC35DRAFT_372859 [Podospora australis]
MVHDHRSSHRKSGTSSGTRNPDAHQGFFNLTRLFGRPQPPDDREYRSRHHRDPSQERLSVPEHGKERKRDRDPDGAQKGNRSRAQRHPFFPASGKRPGQRRPAPKTSRSKQLPKNPKVAIDLKQLDDERLRFERLRFPRKDLSTAKLEHLIRDEYKARKVRLPDDTAIRIYNPDGEEILPDAKTTGKRPTIWYRLLGHGNSLDRWRFSHCVNRTQTDELNQAINQGATIGQFRRKVAGYLGISDANRIRLFADDGMHRRFLEGDDWELRQIGKAWLTRYLAIHVRDEDRYAVCKGLKRNYVIHPPSRVFARGASPWNIGDLKFNFAIDTILNVAKQQGKSELRQLSRRELLSKIEFKSNGVVLRDSTLVKWGTTYDFEFSIDEAEIFSKEETWLLAATESCEICVEDKKLTELPIKITANCRHSAVLCKDCLKQWLSSSAESGNWRRLKCPGVDCTEELQYHDVKRYASKETFQRYDKWMVNDALQEFTGFLQCMAPKCGYGHIQDPACPTFHCQREKCKARHCVKHKIQHEGETCKEYKKRQKARKEQDEASEKKIAGMAKDCPKCKRRVHKTDGCNHMTCYCGHEWCYECLANYSHAQGTGMLLCRHNAGCTESSPPAAGVGPRRNANQPAGPPPVPHVGRPDFLGPLQPQDRPPLPVPLGAAEDFFNPPRRQRHNNRMAGRLMRQGPGQHPVFNPPPPPPPPPPPFMTGANGPPRRTSNWL